jgi:hypothetical protein
LIEVKEVIEETVVVNQVVEDKEFSKEEVNLVVEVVEEEEEDNQPVEVDSNLIDNKMVELQDEEGTRNSVEDLITKEELRDLTNKMMMNKDLEQ